MAFSPDGKQVVSGCDNDTVRVWNAATGAVLQRLKDHTDSVSSMAFSLDGILLSTLLMLGDWVVEVDTNILWLPPDY
jgi:WD40 repeat protein